MERKRKGGGGGRGGERENIKAPEQRQMPLWKTISHTELIIVVQIKWGKKSE